MHIPQEFQLSDLTDDLIINNPDEITSQSIHEALVNKQKGLTLVGVVGLVLRAKEEINKKKAIVSIETNLIGFEGSWVDEGNRVQIALTPDGFDGEHVDIEYTFYKRGRSNASIAFSNNGSRLQYFPTDEPLKPIEYSENAPNHVYALTARALERVRQISRQ